MSECPVCFRRMCCHTSRERGQTYSQMMGDPAGTHKHRSNNCFCDVCTAPSTAQVPAANTPEWFSLRRFEMHRKAADVLAEQAVARKSAGILEDGVGCFAYVVTEQGSEIHLVLPAVDAESFYHCDLAHVQADEDNLVLWVKQPSGKLRKILTVVRSPITVALDPGRDVSYPSCDSHIHSRTFSW